MVRRNKRKILEKVRRHQEIQAQIKELYEESDELIRDLYELLKDEEVTFPKLGIVVRIKDRFLTATKVFQTTCVTRFKLEVEDV